MGQEDFKPGAYLGGHHGLIAISVQSSVNQ